jgi:truncated hemoglobin YjbI
MGDQVTGLHRAVGGTEGWRRLATAFYARVDRDPRIRHLFPGKTLHCAIEELTAFLAQLFGGPGEDTQRRWWLSLRESHRRFEIRGEERAAWMESMVAAFEDAALEEPVRGALRELFERASAHVVNSGPVPTAPEPSGEIARRWAVQRDLDEAVAAIRAGDAARAIALSSRLELGCSVLAGLLGMMMNSGDASLMAYVRDHVGSNPALVRERYAGRTLLHEAAAQGNAAMVEMLLGIGADVDARDGGSHTPLYCVANEQRGAGGADVVRLLVQSGADVNASDGAKRCTALHMAARRGNVEIAEALLNCGAELDPRDRSGDTPLRRAANCDKVQVAALLVARGANLHSIGNKGLTPLQAARSSAMRQILAG